MAYYKIVKKIKNFLPIFFCFLLLYNSAYPVFAQDYYAYCNPSEFQNRTSYYYLKDLSQNNPTEFWRLLEEAEAVCNVLSLTNGLFDQYFNRGASDYPSSSYNCGMAEAAKKHKKSSEAITEAITFIRVVFTKAPAVIAQLGCPNLYTNETLINAGLTQKSLSTLQQICDYCENLNPTQIQKTAKIIRAKLIASEWWAATKEVAIKTAQDVKNYVTNLINKTTTEDCINLSGWKIVKDIFTLSVIQLIEDIIFIPLINILRTILKWIIQVWIWFLTPENFGGYVNFPPVKILWEYIKNLSYLGIVISFIVMAVATILGIKDYDWKKILWRIVIVALLVNFSLVLCGMFIDISNFFTSYFINSPPLYSSDGQPTTYAGLEIKIPHVITKVACHFRGDQGTMIYTAGLFVSLILVIIFIGQFVGILGYTVIRVVTLWITTILSPLAAVAFIIPGLNKIWESWKNYFTQALVSLPAIAFCLWVVIGMLNAFVDGLEAIGKGTGEIGIVAALAHALFIIIIAQATLAVAGALGIQNIQKGYQWANKAIWGALGAGFGYAFSRIKTNVLSSESWRKTAETLEKSQAKIIHDLGIGMQQMTSKTREGELSALEKRLSTKKDDDIRQEAKNNLRWNRRRETAIALNELINRGKIKMEDLPLLQFAKDYINVKGLKDKHPYLYSSLFPSAVQEDFEKAKAEINKQYPQLDEQAVEQKAQFKVLVNLAAGSSPSKLKDMNWEDIFNYIKNIDKTKQTNEYQAVLRDLVNRLTPEGMASVAQSLDIKKQIGFIQDLKEAIKKEAQLSNMTPDQYLLEIKNFKHLEYFRQLLGSSNKQPSRNPNYNPE